MVIASTTFATAISLPSLFAIACYNCRKSKKEKETMNQCIKLKQKKEAKKLIATTFAIAKLEKLNHHRSPILISQYFEN